MELISLQLKQTITTDCATLSQKVLVIKYKLNGKLQESFISFVKLQGHYAEGMSNTNFKELAKLKLERKPMLVQQQ